MEEFDQIIQGKREDFTPPAPPPLPDKRPPSTAPERELDAMQAAREAASQAAQQQRGEASRPSTRPPVNLDKARSTAPGLAKHIAEKKYSYDTALLMLWQSNAGIADDGIYGPLTANALTYFLGKPAPKFLFKGATKDKPWTYTPPR